MPQTEAGRGSSKVSGETGVASVARLSDGTVPFRGNIRRLAVSLWLLTSSAFNRGLRCRGFGQSPSDFLKIFRDAKRFWDLAYGDSEKIFLLSHRCDS